MAASSNKRSRDEAVVEASPLEEMKNAIKTDLPHFARQSAYLRGYGQRPETAIHGSFIQLFPTDLNTVLPSAGFTWDSVQQKELFYKGTMVHPNAVPHMKAMFYARERGFGLVSKGVDGYWGAFLRGVQNESYYGRGPAIKIKEPNGRHEMLEAIKLVLTPKMLDDLTRAAAVHFFNQLFSVCYRNDHPLAAATEAILLLKDQGSALEFLKKTRSEHPSELSGNKACLQVVRTTATILIASTNPLDLLADLEGRNATRDDIFRALAICRDQHLPYRPSGGTKHYRENREPLEAVELKTLTADDEIFTTPSFVTVSELRRINGDIMVFKEAPYRMAGKTQKGAGKPQLATRPVKGEMRKATYFLRLAELNKGIAAAVQEEAGADDMEEAQAAVAVREMIDPSEMW